MLKETFLRRFLIEVLITLVISLCIGFIFQHVALSLFIGTMSLVAWHLYNLFKLSRWIWQQNVLYPPNSFGSWEIIYYGLHKHQQRLRQRQNELAAIIRLFRHGVESSPDALVIVDDLGNIQWCNQQVKQQLGIRWPDDKGQNIVNLVRNPEFAKYLAQENYTEPLTVKVHQRYYIEFRVLPYEHNRHIVVARNVDQVYLAEQQRKDFFTHASHELRTPLTVVKGYVEMFQDELIPMDNCQDALGKVEAQISRMESLISQILLLSKIENMSSHLPMVNIDISNLLQTLILSLQETHADYTIEANIEANLNIRGYQDQVYSVMCNLIDNAIKHNPTKTMIIVTWKKVDAGAYFSVQDNGIGIARHHLNRLTERFYQADSSHTYKKNSSGLGLAIVKHALRNHGDVELKIESVQNHGSTFSFVIPDSFLVKKN